MNTDRCDNCDKPVATQADYDRTREDEGAGLCWRAWNGAGAPCNQPSVDWRARARAAESALARTDADHLAELTARLRLVEQQRDDLREMHATMCRVSVEHQRARVAAEAALAAEREAREKERAKARDLFSSIACLAGEGPDTIALHDDPGAARRALWKAIGDEAGRGCDLLAPPSATARTPEPTAPATDDGATGG